MEITQEKAQLIKEFYFKNINMDIISNETNLNKTDIKSYIYKAGLPKERKLYFKSIITNGLKEGKTSIEVAQELNCDTKKLFKIAENLKIPTYFRQNKKTQREKRILEIFEQEHLNISQMVKKTGYAYSQVQVVYKKNQLLKKVNRNYPYKKLTVELYNKLIIELRKGEKKQKQLAKEYGVSKQRISMIKKKINTLGKI